MLSCAADPDGCKPPGLMVALTSGMNLQPQASLQVSASAGECGKGRWKRDTSESQHHRELLHEKAVLWKALDTSQGQHTMLGHRHSHPHGSIVGLWSIAAGREGCSQSYVKSQQGPDPAHRQETFLPQELHRCG